MLIGGKPYRINTDFRAGLYYAMAAASGDLDAAAFFDIWFIDTPPDEDVSEAVEAVNRFYRRKDEPVSKDADDQKDGSGGSEGSEMEQESSGSLPWDFIQDADIIQADFQRVYNIDLSTARMHWWRFMGLLEGLYGYSFSDRVRFRVSDLQGLDSKQRAHMLKMRARFAIYKDGEKNLDDHIGKMEEIIKRHQNTIDNLEVVNDGR